MPMRTTTTSSFAGKGGRGVWPVGGRDFPVISCYFQAISHFRADFLAHFESPPPPFTGASAIGLLCVVLAGQCRCRTELRMIIENQKQVTTAVLAELARAPNPRF